MPGSDDLWSTPEQLLRSGRRASHAQVPCIQGSTFDTGLGPSDRSVAQCCIASGTVARLCENRRDACCSFGPAACLSPRAERAACFGTSELNDAVGPNVGRGAHSSALCSRMSWWSRYSLAWSESAWPPPCIVRSAVRTPQSNANVTASVFSRDTPRTSNTLPSSPTQTKTNVDTNSQYAF